MEAEDLQQSLIALRSALEETQMNAEGAASVDTIDALSRAVNHVRSTLWIVLPTLQSGEQGQYGAKTRARRARELLEDLLAEIHADTLDVGAPGLELLVATLHELITTQSRSTTKLAALEAGHG